MKDKQVGNDNKNYIRNNKLTVGDYFNISIFIYFKAFCLIIFVKVIKNN